MIAGWLSVAAVCVSGSEGNSCMSRPINAAALSSSQNNGTDIHHYSLTDHIIFHPFSPPWSSGVPSNDVRMKTDQIGQLTYFSSDYFLKISFVFRAFVTFHKQFPKACPSLHLNALFSFSDFSLILLSLLVAFILYVITTVFTYTSSIPHLGVF